MVRFNSKIKEHALHERGFIISCIKGVRLQESALHVMNVYIGYNVRYLIWKLYHLTASADMRRKAADKIKPLTFVWSELHADTVHFTNLQGLHLHTNQQDVVKMDFERFEDDDKGSSFLI